MYKKFGKRLLDIFIAASACLVLFPVFILIALMIMIFDPGPVIFKQQRIGLNGKQFSFFKFRSMPIDTGDIPSDKIGQIKLTWIGQLIRRSNLDELPQLYNIFKGDMSIVGPRPPILSQNELIAIRRQNGALSCRPGLTGLAQVKAFDGMTTSEKAAFDGEYAENVTFILDVKIICNTFFYLLKPPPVY